MEIHNLQNKPDNIRLLVAQRQYYDWAKSWINLNYLVTLLIAIYALVSFVYFPESKSIIGAIGGAWTLLSFLINLHEQRLTTKAAKIQEEFDTEVFGLKWNSTIAGDKESPEDIDQAYSSYKSNASPQFENWYLGMKELEYPKNIQFAQRQNLTWDFRLRRKFAFILIALTLIVFLLGLVISIVQEAKLLDYLIGLFLPSLSIFIKGTREAIGHFRIAKEKERLTNLINSQIKSKQIVEIGELRKIQDKIFLERCKAPLIPNLFYRLLKEAFSNNAQSAIDRIN